MFFKDCETGWWFGGSEINHRLFIYIDHQSSEYIVFANSNKSYGWLDKVRPILDNTHYPYMTFLGTETADLSSLPAEAVTE